MVLPIENKKFVSDLFYAMYDMSSAVSFDGEFFEIPKTPFPYANTVEKALKPLCLLQTKDYYLLPFQKSGMSEFVFSEDMIEHTHRLNNEFLAHRDIRDVDRFGVNHRIIYSTDKIISARRKYSLPVEPDVLLARILIKNEYSKINQHTKDDVWKLVAESPIKSLKVTPYEIVLKELHTPILDKVMSSSGDYNLPNGYLRTAVNRYATERILHILENEELIQDAAVFKELLEPLAFHTIVKSRKVIDQLWTVNEKYAVQRSKALSGIAS